MACWQGFLEFALAAQHDLNVGLGKGAGNHKDRVAQLLYVEHSAMNDVQGRFQGDDRQW